jgi:TolA-binding protein
MINPIFLAAGPELWAAIQERPASPELHAPDFLTARERAAITYLVSESRGDANRETRAVGMFLLGRYEEAIATTRDGDTLSWALYHRADVAYAAGDISAARSGFSELLRRAPQTALADDAALRLGRCAELDGDVAGAIRQFEGGLRLPDGDRHKELEYRIALLTETCDPGTVDALAAAASPGASRPLIEGLYRRLLAVERFPEASAFIRRVDSAAAVVPSSDVEIGLALERAASNGSRADVAVADLFASHQKVLYNSAWGNGRATYVHTIDVRMSVAGTGGVAPNGFIEGVNDYRSALTPEYFAQQNALSHAAARYRRYLSRSWDAAVASKLVSIEARLAYTGSFVYDESVRTASRASALEVYGLLDADRAVDMEVKADAADAIAQVGLQGPGRYAYEQVISDYTTLVRRYPKSHLANNALKRIGWCLEELAGEADPGSGEFLAAYRNAAAAYRRILVEYPGGHVAREAQDRLSEIEGVLYAWQ